MSLDAHGGVSRTNGMTYQSQNRHKHECHDPSECPRCTYEDAAERAAIQTEGQDRSAYERAVALILERRKRGQRTLAV